MGNLNKLYLNNGYVNIPWINSRGFPFNIIIGGRGTGKTYGELKYMLETKEKFLYLRRTQVQVDTVSNDMLSPFKKVCADLDLLYKCDSVGKGITGVWFGDAKLPQCLVCSLSTIANVRGLSIEEYTYCIFDEFIAEAHARPIKNEAYAFFNAYETVNRNRELEGLPAMTAILLSNSDNIASPLLVTANLVTVIDEMKRKGQTIRDLPSRGCSIYLLDDSPISKIKSQTALYKFTQGSAYGDMALENKFTGSSFKYVKSQPLKEYKIILRIGELYVYEHKSYVKYYVTQHRSGTPAWEYESSENELNRARLEHRWLWNAYIFGNIYFESPICQILLQNYLK